MSKTRVVKEMHVYDEKWGDCASVRPLHATDKDGDVDCVRLSVQEAGADEAAMLLTPATARALADHLMEAARTVESRVEEKPC